MKFKKRKPNEETYLYIHNKCSVNPEEALFFDDLQENIDGARKVNINSVLVKDPNEIENDLRKYSII